jgi:hypothetical protein
MHMKTFSNHLITSHHHIFKLANFQIAIGQELASLGKFSNSSIRNSSKLIVLILSMNFLVSTNSFSQEIEWQNTIGGIWNDQLFSIQQTSDGGYILGGTSSSSISGDKLENSYGSYDYWIVKTDSLGAIQWQNTIGGSSGDNLKSVQQTTDGGYILGGESSSSISGDKTEVNFGSNFTKDYWIVKTDSLGNIIWQNTIGGSDEEELKSIYQTADGGYIIGGNSHSNISGDKTENSVGNNGYSDFWIIKIDSIGNIVWQNTIGGNSHDQLQSTQQTSDGGCILGGYSASNISGDKTENCIGGYDYWIVKIDMAGNIQWQNTIGAYGFDYLRTIQNTFDGGFLIGGSSHSNIAADKTENRKGGYDFWIVKVDSMGLIQWQNTIGGNGNDAIFSLQQTADGGFILGGSSESDISGDKTEDAIGSANVSDFWVVKTDSSGNLLWQNTIGGENYDDLWLIKQNPKGGYILGGYSMSNTSLDKTEDCLGNFDYWMVKLTENYNVICGKLFTDFNSNNIQDPGELNLAGRKISEQSTGRIAFSDRDGKFSLIVIDTGSYTVSPQSLNWYFPSPGVLLATFNGNQQTDSLNDFAYQPLGNFDDVCITITPLGAFRSGFSASYQINYGNYGTTTIAPTIYFYPDTNVSFQSATLTPSQITPDSVLWNLPALTPFQTGSIIVTVNLNLGLPIGTLINSRAHIEPYLTDANPSCNNSNWEVYTTGSFDPNDIIVNRSDFTTTELSTSTLARVHHPLPKHRQRYSLHGENSESD